MGGMTLEPIIKRPESAELRSVWPHEAHDFTPWLAANLDWLDILGLGPLTLVGTEVSVPGTSRHLDVLVEDPAGRRIAIENQYRQADHDHLTRGLAYALGLGARALVVIAENHLDEFLAIAAYLNKAREHLGDEGIAVFMVTLEVERVHEYVIPRLQVVERPNAWLEQLHTEGSSSVWEPREERWSVSEFVQWAQDNDVEAAEKVQLLLDEFESHGGFVHGGRAAAPSLTIRFTVPGVGRKWPLCLYSLPQRGSTVEFRFGDFRSTPEVAERLTQAVCSIPDFGLDSESIRDAGYRKMPKFAIKALSEEAVRSLAANLARALLTDNE